MKIQLLTPILIFGFSLGCASHTYTVKENQKTIATQKETVTYTLAGFVPRYRNIDAYELCPSKKVNQVIMWDSGLDGFLCGITLMLYCPKTVEVSCHD